MTIVGLQQVGTSRLCLFKLGWLCGCDCTVKV